MCIFCILFLQFLLFFRDGLSLGSSRHWSVALEAMTGDVDISSDGLLDYFEPLMKFLKAENAKNEGGKCFYCCLILVFNF